MNNIQKAFKEKAQRSGLRMANGGNVGLRQQGTVAGPGTGTSDSVPAMLSKGEYVLPADTVRHVGSDKLDALKDATHTPVNNGLRGIQHLADGGGVGNLWNNVKQGAQSVGDWAGSKLTSSPAQSAPPVAPPVSAPQIAPQPAPQPVTPQPVSNTPLSSSESALLRQPNPQYLGGNNPGLSPEAQSWTNSNTGSAGLRGAAAEVPVAPTPSLGMRAAAYLPSRGQAWGGAAAGAAAVAPYYHAITDDDNGMSAGQRIKMAANAVATGLGGVAGGTVGGVLGAAGGTAVLPVGGTLVGGGAGLLAGGAAGAQLAGNIGSGLRQGANWINGKLGGDPNYITPIADDMQKAGYNPSPSLAQSFVGNPRQTSSPIAPTQPTTTQAAPAPVSTDPRQNFITQSNASMGLSAADQQGAADMSSQGLRGANTALGQNPTGKPTFNLGTYGGDATIFGQTAPGSGKVNSFTGTGTTPDDHGALQDQLTAQSVARMNNTINLTRQVNGLRTAAADNANTGAIQFGGGGGGTITAAAAGARNAHEANQISEANSIRSNDTARWTGERQLAQNLRQMTWDRNKFSTEQGNKDREFTQQQGQNTFANKQASEKSLNDQILQAHTTTASDGKPIVDNDGANATRQGLETMVARQIQDLKRSGSPNDLARAQNLSDNGVNALSLDMRANGIAAVKLMNKVNAGSSNFNPLKPDPLASSDPRDYMNMKTNASGDSVTRTGQVIPSRFMDKKDSDYFMGQPTNEFSGLRARK